MKKLSVQLTIEELQELVELVDNQLFRMKYIDPRLPGYRVNAVKVEAATSAVKALKDTFKAAKGFKTNAA
ncbi:MAG: hypothetical protein LAQ30_01935 [Acidobacteriia bacterium]|nr:hypothetical protein [Terriglobia bacterium]